MLSTCLPGSAILLSHLRVARAWMLCTDVYLPWSRSWYRRIQIKLSSSYLMLGRSKLYCVPRLLSPSLPPSTSFSTPLLSALSIGDKRIPLSASSIAIAISAGSRRGGCNNLNDIAVLHQVIAPNLLTDRKSV